MSHYVTLFQASNIQGGESVRENTDELIDKLADNIVSEVLKETGTKENLITRGWIAPCKAIQSLKIITIIIFLLLAIVCFHSFGKE